MRVSTGLVLDGKTPATSTQKTVAPSGGKVKSSGMGATVGGIVGGTIGQVLGTPADVVTGPGGTMAGGAIGGGIGGAAGEALDEILSGKQAFSKDSLNRAKSTLTARPKSPVDVVNALTNPMVPAARIAKTEAAALGANPEQVVRAAGEQGAYGAIPVGNELRALPLVGKIAAKQGLKGVAGRTGLRAAAGAVGSTVAQAASGDGIDPGQSAISGAANAVVPGLARLIHAPVEGLGAIGKRAVKAGETELEGRLRAPQSNLEQMFGRENTSEVKNGKIVRTADADRLIKEGNLGVEGDINFQKLKGDLSSLSKKKEGELTTVLSGLKTDTGNIKNIVNESLGNFDGLTLDNLPSKLKDIYNEPRGKISLNNLRDLTVYLNKNIQRDPITHAPSDLKSQALEQIRQDLNDHLSNTLDNEGNKTMSQVFKDHSIISTWKRNLDEFTHKGSALPGNLSTELGKQGVSGLSNERKFGNLTRAGATALPAAAGLFIPGLPPEAKLALLALSGGLEVGEFGPRVFPEKGIQVGNAMQKMGDKNLNIQNILQQMGVRL